MKKFYIAAVSMLSLMLVECTSVESTDLDNIKIDNISLGQSINSVDLSKYEEEDEIDNEYNYEFKDLQLKTNDNNDIDKIWVNASAKDLLWINEKSGFKNIDEITSLLGSNYKESWYDKEQGLKSHEYVDIEIDIKLNVVYKGTSNEEQELVWVILESI